MYQKILFHPDEIFQEPLKKYELFFSLLDLSCLGSPKQVGRRSISRAALLGLLTFKNLRSLATLSNLVTELDERPGLSLQLSLKPERLPVERFSSFLQDTDHLWFCKIRESLVKKLIHLQVIKGHYLSLDACPIQAKVRENNLKTIVKNRFCKETPPGMILKPGWVSWPPSPLRRRKCNSSLGYRNHMINDAVSELPLVEMTLPANTRGTSVVQSQLRFVKEQLVLRPKAVMGDSEYDSAKMVFPR